MRITSLRLTNIACFENLFLDCTDQVTGEPAPWVVLIGENGTGKSTILQMIGTALLGHNQFPVIAGDVDWSAYIRDKSPDAEKARSWVWLRPEMGDAGYEPGQPPIQTFFLFHDRAQGGIPAPTDSTPGSRVHAQTLSTLYSDNLTGGWFACGYSSWRRLTRRSNGSGGVLPTFEDSAKPFRFASLFGDGSGLTDVSDWLAGLFFRSIYPGSDGIGKKRFEDAKRALLRALPRITSLEVTADRQVIVTEGKTQVPLERLSDGYRGTLVWVGDLIRRLFDAFPDSPDPLQESGVVLVDEIDLHLHPQWQRSVVENIRGLFPNLQFIVTTHSPFVAQDMGPQDRIIVLERSGRGKRGPVGAREEQGAIHSWSANQILSAYFGLTRGTRGEKAQREEARYERLLDREAEGVLTDKEHAELHNLRLRADHIPLGDTPDEQAFFQTADAVIASLRRRREEREARRNAAGDVNRNSEDAD